MRHAVVFCIALVVAGCGDEARTTSQRPAPAATTKQSKSAAEVLALFKAEMGICTSAMQTFEKDRAFLVEYMDANKRESKPLADFLRNASFANSEDVQYILKNQKYFIVDVTFHPTAFAVAWVKNEPVYCGVSILRLQEIEALGESAEAWEIRAYFLDRWLKDLQSPSNESDFSAEQYEAFNKFVATASKLYSTALRPQFLAWGKTAIAYFEAQRKDLIEGAGGQTVAEQNKILDTEEAAISALLQPLH